MDIRITFDEVCYTNDDKLFIRVQNLKINEYELGTQEISVLDKISAVILEEYQPKMYYELDEDWTLSDNELFTKIQSLVQEYIDKPAKDLNYENGFYLASYCDSTIEKFKNEARKFVEFRDACWTICYGLLGKYENGEIRRPLSSEVLELLPEY